MITVWSQDDNTDGSDRTSAIFLRYIQCLGQSQTQGNMPMSLYYLIIQKIFLIRMYCRFVIHLISFF